MSTSFQAILPSSVLTRLSQSAYEHYYLGGLLFFLHCLSILQSYLTQFSLSHWISSSTSGGTWLGFLLLWGLAAVHWLCFQLWQPLERKEWHRHYFFAFWIGGTLLFAIVLNHWLLMLWQIILIAILGGRDLVKPRDQLVNVLAILILLLNLFMVNVHQQFVLQLAVPNMLFNLGFDSTLSYVLIVLMTVIILIPPEESEEYRYYVDFFHGLTVALITLILLLGSLVILYHNNTPYPVAIFQMALIMALCLFTISWLWALLTGEMNANHLWMRHLVHFESTMEQWLQELAQPSIYKNLTPQQFLLHGLDKIARLPWVSGLHWNSLYGEGSIGALNSQHFANFSIQSLEVIIFAQHRISNRHYLHIKFLIQLLEAFHQAKRREAAFAQQAHLQAIYETGAKLTHDIKNLLQSLHAISSAIESCRPSQFEDTQRLLQGQMPLLTQRLKRTLDKLQKPAEFSYTHIPVSLWWSNLKSRYHKQNIFFQSHTETENVLIPEDLFDNVAENLLQNAIAKRKREPEIQLQAGLEIQKGQLRFTICDNGSQIAPDIANSLFSQPVPSRDGFGIGLYQLAKQIKETGGYKICVLHNEEGEVCFELASES